MRGGARGGLRRTPGSSLNVRRTGLLRHVSRVVKKKDSIRVDGDVGGGERGCQGVRARGQHRIYIGYIYIYTYIYIYIYMNV